MAVWVGQWMGALELCLNPYTMYTWCDLWCLHLVYLLSVCVRACVCVRASERECEKVHVYVATLFIVCLSCSPVNTATQLCTNHSKLCQ